MRRDVSIRTYQKILDFFKDHKKEEFSISRVRDETHTDFYSTKLAVQTLIDQGHVKQKGDKYRYGGRK